MSNSSLVNYTKISPNRNSPRNKAIDTITIHCMAGDISVESCGNIFAPAARQASSNYGVDSNGRIGMYVEEKDRSWCTSSAANDNRAVTIEVASGSVHPYKVNDKAMDALIKLCADICKRNGIKELVWRNDKSNPGNMTVHRWFAAKACPGDYLMEKMGFIADEVNKIIGAAQSAADGQTIAGTPILGTAEVSATALSQYLIKRNPEPKLRLGALELALLYIEEGKAEGVRGDIAFCQSCVETGYWKFGGDVKPEQNNFAGIGATGNGNPGNVFADPRQGVRAQIQHLKAYATEEPLKQACVDPRYSFVKKGIAPTWEELSGKWATDKGYGEKILAIFKDIKDGAGVSNNVSSPQTGVKFEPYTIRITVGALNVRDKPSSAAKAVTCLINDKNIYTIVEEADGPGANKWGKLKSGLGWIALDYTKKA